MSMPFEAAAINLKAQSGPALSSRKIRTVVVDDSPALLESISIVLELGGLIDVVATAQDGVEAVKAVATLRPELLLMDVNMPVMNGCEAAVLIATHFPAIKVVLMSGEDSVELRQQCAECGAHGFVFKVHFAEELAAVLAPLFPEHISCFTA